MRDAAYIVSDVAYIVRDVAYIVSDVAYIVSDFAYVSVRRCRCFFINNDKIFAGYAGLLSFFSF